MPLARGLAALVFLACLHDASAVRAEALRRVEAAATPAPRVLTARASERPPRSRARSYGARHGWAGGEEEDEGNELFLLNVSWQALTALWSVPHLFDDARLERYAAHPFADGPGLLRHDEDELAQGSRRVALQMDAESGYLLQGVLPGTFAARAQLPMRFELSARVSLLTELDSHAEQAIGSTAHVIYRHAQTARVDFRTGVGLRTFRLGHLLAGVDLMYAVDAYLSRWAVLRLEAHAGSLGKSFAAQARATLGVMIKRCELYAGYDQTVFSGHGSARLGGPVAGLRAWF